MTTRYVGSGGNDGNSGLTWALRKLTLNGIEDTPVVAGDTVYVGPGVYREMLTCDVSGSAGLPITYIGDYTGANTDGVGGVVRITGSDDDQTATRNNCITASSKNYRSFTSLDLGHSAQHLVNISGTNWTFISCAFHDSTASNGIFYAGADQASLSVSNCLFFGFQLANGRAVYLYHSATVSNAAHVISSCLFYACGDAVRSDKVGGITVRNCTITGSMAGVRIGSALAVGQTMTVNNCILSKVQTGLIATTTAEFAEDYNSLYDCQTARTNVNVGAHSNTYPPLFDTRWFFEAVNGGRMVTPFDLGAWSQLINLAGTSPPATDMRGTAVQGAQREWGPLEYDTTLLIESAAGGGGAVSISPFRGNIG